MLNVNFKSIKIVEVDKTNLLIYMPGESVCSWHAFKKTNMLRKLLVSLYRSIVKKIIKSIIGALFIHHYLIKLENLQSTSLTEFEGQGQKHQLKFGPFKE